MASHPERKPVRLIAGLGNPGEKYMDTRHNAGAWLIESIAEAYNERLYPDKKCHGVTGQVQIGHQTIRLLIPSTFMNLSGQSVLAMADFYRIPIESILIAHDELDFPAGQVRLKSGGGHGGHNGLRDIINKFSNSKGFSRLRIGIGHPGPGRDVAGYVLKPPSKTDKPLIKAAIDKIIDHLAEITSGNWNKAVQQLHEFNA